jgi:hypothetical protein
MKIPHPTPLAENAWNVVSMVNCKYYTQDYVLGLFHRPRKTVILCVIHHRQNSSESTVNIMLAGFGIVDP